MTPRPDHGETSYVGSGRLKGTQGPDHGRRFRHGRAAAIAYAREGADVAINYLPAEEPDAREVEALIRQAGRKAVADPGRPARGGVLQTPGDGDAIGQLGGLDIVVCNAGSPASSQVDPRPHHRGFRRDDEDQHLCAVLDHQGGAAPPAARRGDHRHRSEQAYDPSGDLYDYAQTKAATMNYVKSLAKQLGPKGIRVNGVAPGPIWTPLQISGGARKASSSPSAATSPLGRPGQPAELAGIYVRLAEDDGSYTTGNIYGAGGGQGSPEMTKGRSFRRAWPCRRPRRLRGDRPRSARRLTRRSSAPPLIRTNTRSCLSRLIVARRARTRSVRGFAQQMIDHHGQTEALAEAVAAAVLPPAPQTLGGDQQRMLNALQSLNGPALDRTYMTQQVGAHVSALVTQQDYATSGSDPNLRKAAQSTVPMIQHHLETAKQLKNSMPAD
jgi:NAD(P)-dependent dehydrogenase (short-subunit alcohol dehydrogenase family)/predicted outer membrane protein